MNKKGILKLLIFGTTGILMGILFSSQSKSVESANVLYNRENRESIFKEIQIVKQSNDNLQQEMNRLSKELVNSNNREQVLKNIEMEINKYRIVDGLQAVKGPGIILTINGQLPVIWLTDAVNELNSAGAEIISVNGQRITNTNIGFDTMPNGQILMNGTILQTPYQIKAIGDKKTLYNSLKLPGGFLQRIKNYKSGLIINLTKQNIINIDAYS